MDKTIQLKRSSVVNDGVPKLPTADQLKYGEIAINFAVGHETISLKNSNDEIVPIKINGDGKVLTQNDVVDIEPEVLTDADKKKAISAYKVFSTFNVLETIVNGDNTVTNPGLIKKVNSNANKIDTNTTNITANTKAISGLTTGLDEIAVEVHGDGTSEKPGLIKDVSTLENEFDTTVSDFTDFKTYVNNELTTIKKQLNGIETQTTSIISQEDDIITNAQ